MGLVDVGADRRLHPALMWQRHVDLSVAGEDETGAVECVGPGGEELVRLADLFTQVGDERVDR